MKKILSAFIVLAMILVMVIPGFASSMSITTSVPYEHKVVVTHNDGGYVLVNGKICPDGTQFNINRFGEISLSFVFKNGYHLNNVEVNGIDVTDKLVSGILKISDINSDVLVKVTFEKCSSDPDDKCGKVDMEGTVYLGEKEVKGAELSFDFGSVTAKTDADGRYFVKDIADGKHLVTISKDGEVLANTAFVIERADVDKVTLSTASDGTQIAIIPLDAEKIYLDFNIADNDKNGIPDKDPDDTNPGDPDNPNFEDPDKPNITPDPDDDGDGILDKDDPDHPDYDSDDDGVPDRVDNDDDNDGVPDVNDDDDDGDGILDKDDPNHPDRDTDGDGTPDKDDNDDDNDGIPDAGDDDDDNDGIPDKDDSDSSERDTDGDGIPDVDDEDDDNDGLPDGPLYDGTPDDDDKDTDGDGTPDSKDDDDDNDGILDSKDPDKDGDGHIDDYDGTPDGDDDNDGVVITIGGPKKDVPIIPNPDTFVEFFGQPVTMISLMALSLFFFILILFKRKKDEEDEREVIVEE